MADKIYWVPLESNPDVMNSWCAKAGLVTSQDAFTDVYGFDPELLAMVPQPVKAVVLLFPTNEAYEKKRREEDAKLAREGQHPIDPTVIWIKQTIGNACGAMGLIHALANSSVTLAPESPLAQFFEQCIDKTPEERSKLLEATPLLANIHAEVAVTGQTTAPPAEAPLDDHHFTCLVQAPSPPSREEGIEAPEGAQRLIELDGSRNGPLDRGASNDLLADAARFIKENYFGLSENLEFGMVALAPPA